MHAARAGTGLDSSDDSKAGSCGIKAVEILHPSSKTQLFSYMKLLDIPIGLLINFHEPILKNGISRMILPRANQAEQDGSNDISF
jgi:PD-(D/E)XK nuclease superfamily